MSKKIVVCGATGYLGAHVVRAASAAGWRVRALARDEARLAPVRQLCEEVFVGEAADPSSIRGLFDGADVAFSSIGVRHLRPRPSVWAVDRDANLGLVDEAERAGVERFVFVSLLHGERNRHTLAVAEARETVVDRIRESGMSAAVIRPSGFFNDMAQVFEMARRGRVWAIGRGTGLFNPIHGADLADRIVMEFEGEGIHELEVGGPDVITMKDAGRMAFAALGTEARFGRVPAWLVRAAAAMVRPFDVNLSTFARMFALVADGDAIAPSFGTHHLADEMANWAREEPERTR